MTSKRQGNVPSKMIYGNFGGVLLDWNCYPPTGVSYFEHQVSFHQAIKAEMEKLEKQGKALIQIRAGKIAYLSLKSLPDLGLTIIPCNDLPSREFEILQTEAKKLT